MKAAALSERSQAEEELIKAKNQVRLEEVSAGSRRTACSTHGGESTEGTSFVPGNILFPQHYR